MSLLARFISIPAIAVVAAGGAGCSNRPGAYASPQVNTNFGNAYFQGQYFAGRARQQDLPLAAHYYTAAVARGDTDRAERLGDMYAAGRGVAVDPTLANYYWSIAAASYQRDALLEGSPLAALKLGKLYRDGRGVPRDDALAIRWLTRAAQGGKSEAWLDLGDLYYDHRSDDPSYPGLAVSAYQRAVASGDERRLERLGDMYSAGTGVATDAGRAATLWAQAAATYRRSAEAGSALDAFRLGRLYLDGKGVAKSAPDATRWLDLAADRGNAAAANALGDAYYAGETVTKDEFAARAYYTEAVAGGNGERADRLGDMRAAGRGGPPDMAGAAQAWAAAAAYYQAAAGQGRQWAIDALARMRSQGKIA